MLYNTEEKQVMLDALENKVSSIVDVCMALLEEGYIPNKNKFFKLSWFAIMIDAYNNIDILNSEQQKNLEVIYNKLITL